MAVPSIDQYVHVAASKCRDSAPHTIHPHHTHTPHTPLPLPHTQEDNGTDDCHLLLKETDFIRIFDQFMFTDLFQHILSGTTGGGGCGLSVFTPEYLLMNIYYPLI